MVWRLAAIAGLAWAAHLDLEAERAFVRAAAGRCFESAQRLLNQPLEAAKIAVLTGFVDSVVRESAAALEAAGRLDGLLKKAVGEMESAVKGRGRPSLEKLIEDAGRPREELDKRAYELRGRFARIDPDRYDPRLKAMIEKAFESVEKLRGELEEAVDSLKDRARRSQETYKKAAAVYHECEKALGAAAGADKQIAAAAGPARSRIASLGAEPQAETRTRAWMAVEPLGGLAQTLSSYSDSLLNRSDDFRHVHERFRELLNQFDAIRKNAGQYPDALKDRLDHLEKLIEKAEEASIPNPRSGGSLDRLK